MDMQRRIRRCAWFGILSFATLITGADEAGQTWPTWRGPGMRALAPGKPPVTFSEQENIKWKVELPGKGDSTPVIWGDKIFLLAASKTDQKLPPGQPVESMKTNLSPEMNERMASVAKRFGITTPEFAYDFQVLCLSRADGAVRWQKTVRRETPHEGHHRDHGFASGSPVTDGTHIWCFFGSRGMHCLDLEGNIIWSRELGKMLTRARFGEASSPALTRKAVIALLDHEGDSSIVALDRLTGETLWEKARNETTSWTTPLVVVHDGVEQIIVSGTTRTYSYAPATGEIIWECGGQTANVIPAPSAAFGMVYCSSGFRGNMLQAIHLGRTGDLTGTDAVAWEVKKNAPYVPSPLLYGEQIHMFAGYKPKLTCVNAKTGAVQFAAQNIEGMKAVYASPVGASGRIYVAGRQGAVAVLGNGTTFKVLAVNRLDDKFDASPAIVGDELYLRGKKSLYCIATP